MDHVESFIDNRRRCLLSGHRPTAIAKAHSRWMVHGRALLFFERGMAVLQVWSGWRQYVPARRSPWGDVRLIVRYCCPREYGWLAECCVISSLPGSLVGKDKLCGVDKRYGFCRQSAVTAVRCGRVSRGSEGNLFSFGSACDHGKDQLLLRPYESSRLLSLRCQWMRLISQRPTGLPNPTNTFQDLPHQPMCQSCTRPSGSRLSNYVDNVERRLHPAWPDPIDH